MPAHFNWDWELGIQYNPQEVGEPYELYFFLGSTVPPSPADWGYPLSLFEPIMSHAHTTTTEFRDLNGYLEHHCGDGTLKDDDVIPYLRKHLSWRVKKRYSDEEIEKSKLKALKVTLYGPDGAIALGDERSCVQ